MTFSYSVAQVIFLRLATWLLISFLWVSSAQGNKEVEILGELLRVSQSYGVLPNVHTLVDLASTSSTSPATHKSADSPCVRVITLTNSREDAFYITKETNFCSAFFKTGSRSKLTFQISIHKLYPCDEEYLHINDGATLESTLCDGKASVESRRSRFLFVQFGRQTKTRTAFNITVKAVPDGNAHTEVTKINKILEKSFSDGQICEDCGYTTKNVRRARVLGGSPALVTENPWMVGVHITRKTADLNSSVAFQTGCGASILDRKHVLTAAHCITTEDTTSKYPRVTGLHVVAGSDLGLQAQDTDVHAQKIDVEYWIAHPSYDPNEETGRSYDIAVLRLKKKLQFNHRVAPVCLAAPLDFLGADVTVTGYGFVVSEGTIASQLQAVKLGIRPGEACDTTFKGANDQFVFQSHQLCIYSPNKDACRGDSGGPAVLKWTNRSYQVGVVSFGLDCSDEHIRTRVGGYTRVSSFIPWIKSLLQGNSTC